MLSQYAKVTYIFFNEARPLTHAADMHTIFIHFILYVLVQGTTDQIQLKYAQVKSQARSHRSQVRYTYIT